MRFKTSVRNITTFTRLTASLSSLSRTCWLRLSPTDIRFVLTPSTPSTTTQVWATLSLPTLFGPDYRISSAAANFINLEVPLAPLHRALRSCATAVDATLRLTKRASDGVPVLCLTITSAAAGAGGLGGGTTLVTQEIPVRVLSAAMVEAIKEPSTPDADVHIYLPGLASVRGIVERLVRLGSIGVTGGGEQVRIVVGANGEGKFRMRLEGEGAGVKVESCWSGLQNPVLTYVGEEGGGGEEEADDGGGGGGGGGGGESQKHKRRATSAAVASQHDKSAWAEARVDGKEWSKVLRVGQLARRVVLAICHDRALVLYVFLTDEGDADETVLTYYMSSYSA